MKTEFTVDWKNWIKNNVDSGKDRDGIFRILLDEGYEHSAIVSEMNYTPSRPISEIKNPFEAAKSQNKFDNQTLSKQDNKYGKNNGLPIQKEQIYVPNSLDMESDKIDLRLVENFLNAEECEALIEDIKRKKRPSTVGDYVVDARFRTSQTCDLGHMKNHSIADIDSRICRLIGIAPAYSECIQGQYYEVGQEFKAHTDFFDMDGYDTHCSQTGQRTYTVMIYLNDVEAGGETTFKRVDVSLKPIAGMAVIWNNLNPDGTPNHKTLHQAKPVEKGYKAIITKWFRTTSPRADKVKMFTKEANEFIPSYTGSGFVKTKMPDALFEMMNSFYQDNRKNSEHEFVEGDFIVAGEKADKNHPSSNSVINIPPELRQKIHDSIKPSMETWCNQKLESTLVDGIREHHNGAALKMQRGNIETDIISAIINVDQETDKAWPFCIEDNYYRRHLVMLKPGEVIFYEGGRLLHGRPIKFEGTSFANLFCHFKPVGYVPPHIKIAQL